MLKTSVAFKKRIKNTIFKIISNFKSLKFRILETFRTCKTNLNDCGDIVREIYKIDNESINSNGCIINFIKKQIHLSLQFFYIKLLFSKRMIYINLFLKCIINISLSFYNQNICLCIINFSIIFLIAFTRIYCMQGFVDSKCVDFYVHRKYIIAK